MVAQLANSTKTERLITSRHEGCREGDRDRGMKYAGVKRRGRRNGRRKREGERASGWYHVLNQTKRNVLGLHEG